MRKIAIIFKTHVWSNDICIFCKKILFDIRNANIDFFIILHDEKDNIIDTIPANMLQYVLIIKESDIKIYDSGFISMWMSNHWILMWFFLHNRDKYNYIWSIEYDVRIIGNSNLIWSINDNADFIYTLGNNKDVTNKYSGLYSGKILSDDDKYYGHLQLARYSMNTLNYLHNNFKSGENGYDELITFSLLNRSNLKLSNILHTLIGGIWTWDQRYSLHNRRIITCYNNSNTLKIFHPVK